jgi:hypothetical protein
MRELALPQVSPAMAVHSALVRQRFWPRAQVFERSCEPLVMQTS